MKRIILTALLPMLMATSAVFGALLIDPIDPAVNDTSAVDPNSHINLFTSGSTSQTSMTVAAGSAFSLDTYIQFSGYTAVGLSYWLEADSALAPHLTLTSESYFQNWNANQGGTNSAFATSSGADSGFLRESRDLGSTSGFDTGTQMFTDPKSAGPSYKVSTLNFALDASTPPGVYTLQLTTLNPVPSEITEPNNGQFIDHDVATVVYTITVIPEPATLSLLALGGLGSVGLTMLRSRRRG